MTERAASNIHDGWIKVPYPAMLAGWHHITRAEHAGGWSTFHCGRPAPYTVSSHFKLEWSRHRPGDA